MDLRQAKFDFAQPPGASFFEAHLQEAQFQDAHLQGADLSKAHLQGAYLYEALLQGADLSNADLSVLPKGFSLPVYRGSAGEEAATTEDQPTDLTGANLSVLPRGSECKDWVGGPFKVSDAARPTNLTEVKASGAMFTGADLSGANFAGATLKDTTLTNATFAPLQPPERPTSGALDGAWQAKALMGGVARAAMAAADDGDDDDDDSDDGSDDEEEEESPVDAKMETALNAFFDNLAAAAQSFMHTVNDMVSKVEELLKSSLLKSCKETRRINSSASVPDADSILAKELCKKLETANDKPAAIFEIISTRVLSPLFAQHLPKVLKDARSELPQPTDEAGAAGHQLLEQLLEIFTERALGAGKAALLKRLSPIVSKCVGAISSIIEGSAEGGGFHSRRASSRRMLGPGPAADEEQPLMQPKDSAACLVQELWPALRASLEAQAHRHQHTPQPLPIIMSPKRSLSTINCRSVCIFLVAHAVCR